MAFELAAVQRLELSPKLLVFQFCSFALPVFLAQFFGEFFQLVFVVALGAHDLLVAIKDPTGGQSFQVRASVAVIPGTAPARLERTT